MFIMSTFTLVNMKRMAGYMMLGYDEGMPGYKKGVPGYDEFVHTISKTIGEQHVQSQETIIVQCLFNDKSQAQGLDHVNFR